MTIIALSLCIAFALSYTLTSLARYLAPKIGFIDAPDGERKNHVAPTPVLGGAAIYLSIVTMFLLGLAFEPPRFEGANQVAGLLASSTLFFLVGLVDDWRPLTALQKLTGQSLASIPFVLWGQSFASVELFGIDVTLAHWGPLITVFWLVSCSNIINLVDGLDGLASSISVIVLATIGIFAWSRGNGEQAFLTMIVVASIGGFLMQNLPPAKIFLGDSGALMLGFLVGAFAIESSVKQATAFTLVGTVVMLSVPVFDATMAVLRRKLRGKSISEADRDHIHHRLQDHGLSRQQTLMAMICLSLGMAVITYVAEVLHNDGVSVLLCLSLLASLVIGRVFGHYETTMLGRYIKAFGTLSLDLVRVSGSRVMLVKLQDDEFTNENNAWDMVCAQVSRQGVHALELDCRNSQGQPIGFLNWRSASSLHNNTPDCTLHLSAQGDEGITTRLTALISTSDAETFRSANDLLVFCNSLCSSKAIIRCALKDFQSHGLQDQRSQIIPFPTTPGAQLSAQTSHDRHEASRTKSA